MVRKRDLALPIVGALLASIAINLRKLGLEQINEPILGSMMGFTSALVVYLMILAASPQVRSGFRFKIGDVPFFVAGGVSLALGWLCIFFALSHGDVVLVAPLAGLYPLVVVVLSVFFLKDVERVSVKTVIGCCTVLLGVMLVTAF